MKKSKSNIPALIGVFTLLLFIVACTNNNESTKSSASDSANVSTANDTSMNHMQPADTAAANVSTEKSANKETANKGTANKATATRKKGKASIGAMSEMKTTTERKTAMVPDKNGVYDVTEVRPAYPGGQTALSDYIANNIEYPQMAIDDNKEGTVSVQFVVDENGKVQNARVIGSKLGDGLDEEAERAISSMRKWTPGQVKGKAVKTRLAVPITFKLSEQ